VLGAERARVFARKLPGRSANPRCASIYNKKSTGQASDIAEAGPERGEIFPHRKGCQNGVSRLCGTLQRSHFEQFCTSSAVPSEL